MHSAYGARLLSIGEIFDRAVHLTIANLLPLAAIVGLVEVPTRAIADWISRDALNYSFGYDGRVVADPRLLLNYFTLIRSPNAHGFDWPAFLWLLASLLPLSLATGAASIAARGILVGNRAKLGAAYGAALRRIAPIFGASILAYTFYLLAFIAIIIVAVVFLLLWSGIFSRGGPVGDPAGTVVVIMVFIGVCVTFAWLMPLAICTTTGAALYTIRPLQALREGRLMTISRGLRARSLAFGAALIAFVVTEEIIASAICGLLSDISHSSILSFVALDTFTLLALVFEMALAVVFYLDARNRVVLLQDPLAEQENSRSQ